MASSPTLLAGQDMTALLMGVPAWTAMTPLTNSWVDAGGGNVVAQYRKWPLLNSVELIGVISTGTNGTVFFTLPAGNIPASQQQFAAGTSGGAAWNNQTFIQCSTAGALSVQAMPTGATIVFHGWISLDA